MCDKNNFALSKLPTHHLARFICSAISSLQNNAFDWMSSIYVYLFWTQCTAAYRKKIIHSVDLIAKNLIYKYFYDTIFIEWFFHNFFFQRTIMTFYYYFSAKLLNDIENFVYSIFMKVSVFLSNQYSSTMRCVWKFL